LSLSLKQFIYKKLREQGIERPVSTNPELKAKGKKTIELIEKRMDFLEQEFFNKETSRVSTTSITPQV